MMSTDASRKQKSAASISFPSNISQGPAVLFYDPGNISMEVDQAPNYPDIQGYYLSREIGGGGFSKVYRAVHRQTRGLAACKVINLYVNPAWGLGTPNIKELQKEVQVHKALKNPYILEFLHHETIKIDNPDHYTPGLYMLLELAVGGDLFDKIAPDVGVPEDLAKFYFAQMVAGVEFIHAKGIAHRDLKPENLLLAANGNLKITDFGLCAVFRHKGKTRLLSGRCGSLPYVAPELGVPAGQGYAAEPVDIWGMGVVLYTLLVGNTPWDEPSESSPEFCAYRTGELFNYDPWTRIRGQALDILKGLLCIDPQQRLTISGIKHHPWCMTQSQLRREQLSEALTQGIRQEGMMAYADPVFRSGESQAYAASRGARMAGDTDWLSKEESQFMRGTGNITQSGDLMTITTRFWMALPPNEAFQILAAFLQSDVADANGSVRAVAAPSAPGDSFSGSHGAGGVIKLHKAAGHQYVEGKVVVLPSDSLAAEGQSLVIMQRAKGSILHWRALWWSVVRANELQDYVIRGDM
ncbi:hypothetical protein AYX14_02491 [Cryptococcus neoformans]|nr:hypothetical protein AYX15_02407 [Cryptococcus neoformans var. grubii]OWZ72047.1 hypothetical protein AYX14_02491 [Cryptococcus neoformans var. grubii]